MLLPAVAGAGVLDAAKVPGTAGTLSEFVPAGWKIEAQTRGDLDGDRLDDAVLELVEVASDDQRERALVVALADGKGGWRRAGVGPKALLCDGCAGALGMVGDRPSVVTLEKNVILIDEMWGSREMSTVKLRIRWDATKQRMRVIGRDESVLDRLEGGGYSTSTNYLTGTTVVTLQHKDQIDPAAIGPVPKAGTTKGAPMTIWLEDVDTQD